MTALFFNFFFFRHDSGLAFFFMFCSHPGHFLNLTILLSGFRTVSQCSIKKVLCPFFSFTFPILISFFLFLSSIHFFFLLSLSMIEHIIFGLKVFIVLVLKLDLIVRLSSFSRTFFSILLNQSSTLPDRKSVV